MHVNIPSKLQKYKVLLEYVVP